MSADLKRYRYALHMPPRSTWVEWRKRQEKKSEMERAKITIVENKIEQWFVIDSRVSTFGDLLHITHVHSYFTIHGKVSFCELI